MRSTAYAHIMLDWDRIPSLTEIAKRQDWGYRYLAAPSATKATIHSAAESRQAFVNGSYAKLQAECLMNHEHISCNREAKPWILMDTASYVGLVSFVSVAPKGSEFVVRVASGWGCSESGKGACFVRASGSCIFKPHLPDVWWGALWMQKSMSHLHFYFSGDFSRTVVCNIAIYSFWHWDA